MKRRFRQASKRIGETCLQKNRAQSGSLMGDLPQALRWSRVCAEDHRVLAIAHDVAKGRDYVIDGNGRDLESIGFHCFFRLDRIEMQERWHVARERYKVRPHDVVEDVLLNGVDGLVAAVDASAMPCRRPGVLDEDGEAGGVVGVRVGEEDVFDRLLLLGSAIEAETAHVDSDGAVDQVAADVLPPRGIGHRRSQKFDLHLDTSAVRNWPCSSQVSISPLPFTCTTPRLSNSKVSFRRSKTLRVT